MLKRAVGILKSKQGVTIIICICLMAFFTLLGTAVMISAASYAANAQQQRAKDQTYVTAKTMTAVLESEMANPSSELGQRLFCEFNGEYTVLGYDGTVYVLEETGNDENYYWDSKTDDNSDNTKRTVSVSPTVDSTALPDGGDISESGDISLEAEKVLDDDISTDPVMFIYVTAELGGQKYRIQTCYSPSISNDGTTVSFNGWNEVYTSGGGGNGQ